MPADGTAALSTSSSSAYVGETQAFFVTARNEGPLALEGCDTRRSRCRSDFTLAVGRWFGSFPARSASARHTCDFGTLPAGESRRIDVSARRDSRGPRVGRWHRSARRTTSVTSNDGAYARPSSRRRSSSSRSRPTPAAIDDHARLEHHAVLHAAIGQGHRPVVDASVTLNVTGMQIVSVAGVGATCRRNLRELLSMHCTRHRSKPAVRAASMSC